MVIVVKKPYARILIVFFKGHWNYKITNKKKVIPVKLLLCNEPYFEMKYKT